MSSSCEHATVIRGGEHVSARFNWKLHEGEACAIVGPPVSGKTTLAETLLGKHASMAAPRWPLFDRLACEWSTIDYPSQVVTHVTFHEESRLFSYAGRYYQQRFEFADSDDPAVTRAVSPHGLARDHRRIAARFANASALRVAPTAIYDALKRPDPPRRLARAMLAKPELLILDDPFIGLDSAGAVISQPCSANW